MKHLFLTTALVVGLPLAAAAQEVTIKMGHAASSKHIFHEGLELFASKVAEKTDGSVAIEVFGDRQLGDDKQLLEGLQIGLIEGALVSSATLPLVLELSGFDALQLPFITPSYQRMAEVLTSDLGEELLATLDGKSIKGVGFIEAGQRHFLAESEPITTLEGFAGRKTRIVPIPLHKATWEAIGVNPIGMAYGEVYSALETGTIDAVEINLSSVQSESLYDAAKQVTLTGHYFWPGAIMLSNNVWSELNDEQKAAIEEAGRETTAESYVLAENQETETTSFLEENGVRVSEISDMQAMREKTAPVVEKWTAKDPLIARIVDALAAGN